VDTEERPLMSFGPPLDPGPLDGALQRLAEYDAIALTSPRAAQALGNLLTERAIAWPPASGAPEVWASGPATAAGLGGGLGSIRLPAGRPAAGVGAAAALATAMLEDGVKGRVLFPCGESHRDELPRELRAGGAVVDEIVCYRSVLADAADARVAAQRATVLVVASPRVADLLARACPRHIRPELLAVGPTTAATARLAGWPPAAVASEPTVRSLAAAIQALLDKR
jgi:uroporphyrinogen-III synthase